MVAFSFLKSIHIFGLPFFLVTTIMGDNHVVSSTDSMNSHEKEMWAVIYCLKTWGHYIGSKDVVVWTDNVTLKYFATQPK